MSECSKRYFNNIEIIKGIIHRVMNLVGECCEIVEGDPNLTNAPSVYCDDLRECLGGLAIDCDTVLDDLEHLEEHPAEMHNVRIVHRLRTVFNDGHARAVSLFGTSTLERLDGVMQEDEERRGVMNNLPRENDNNAKDYPTREG